MVHAIYVGDGFPQFKGQGAIVRRLLRPDGTDAGLDYDPPIVLAQFDRPGLRKSPGNPDLAYGWHSFAAADFVTDEGKAITWH